MERSKFNYTRDNYVLHGHHLNEITQDILVYFS